VEIENGQNLRKFSMERIQIHRNGLQFSCKVYLIWFTIFKIKNLLIFQKN